MVRLFEIFDAIPISSWVREARWYRFPGFCLNGRELSFVRAGHRFIYCSDSDRLVVSGGITHDDLLVVMEQSLSLIHISEPTRLGMISYAVFCLKKKKE